MTQTPQGSREELRESISNMMVDLMIETALIELGGRDDMLKQGHKLIKAHNSKLDHIMQLIATREREARIDEVKRVPWKSVKRYSIEAPYMTKAYYHKRIVDLTSQSLDGELHE